jgi:TolA-binding protein
VPPAEALGGFSGVGDDMLLGFRRFMKLWPFFSLLLLISQRSPAGQRVDSSAEKGEDALAAQLWNVAEQRFREGLADRNLAATAKAPLTLRLCEALIRGGKSSQALELLNLPAIAAQPEAAFWKAQALVGLGRLPAASEIFSQQLSNPAAPNRPESAFSLANLQLTLGQPERAIATLKLLADATDPQTVARSRLRRAAILLDLQRPSEARLLMPEAPLAQQLDQKFAELLEAKLRFAEGHFTEAAAAYQALAATPDGQSLAHFHTAILGLADSQYAAGKRELATHSLLAFVQENPTSPVLAAIFKRLADDLPSEPTTSEPILRQLSQWITPAELPSYGLIAANSDVTALAAIGPPINPAGASERLAHALFTRAVGLHRIATAEAKSEAQRLLTRLRLENPSHPLAEQALYQLARWSLESGDSQRAAFLFELIHDRKQSPNLQGRAAFLAASNAFAQGDFPLASRLFNEATQQLEYPSNAAAKFNEALGRLRSGDLKAVTLIQQSDKSPEQKLARELQLERALALPAAGDSKKALAEFIAQNPADPQLSKAQIAAIEAALTMVPPDLDYAKSQLERLTANPPAEASIPASQLAFARLRYADLSSDPAATIALARQFIETYPAAPQTADASFTLGRNLFKIKDYNPARLILEKLAVAATDPARAQVAWLLAARSAALVGTLSSKEEALVLFDKASAQNGPLTAIAKLEKADHLIKNMYRFGEAAELLRQWLKALPKNDSLRLPAGLLLGQALYAEGTTTPDSLREALAIYDQLIPFSDQYPALVHRLQYLRGLALEQLPDEKDPLKKRDDQAFIAYYSVLETTEPPSEWEYFELCGFKALSLKERSAEWRAAIAVAEKITRFKGPRAAEAAARAKQLKLTHLIWEDGPLESDP